MDALDQALIAQLRHNARASIAQLSQSLGVARGTITNRMARLEREGVIAGYTVRLRPDAQRDDIRAWSSIAVEGNQQAVIRALMGEPGVEALHDTNGRWDLLAELRVDNLQALAESLERMRKIRGITATETSIHLQTYRG